MTRLVSLAAVILTVALTAASCKDKPTEPSGFPDPTFRATLNSTNEVPPVSNAEAGASGIMDITINATRDANGVITAATASFNGNLTGFPPGTALTLAHIHTGAAGVNGGFIVNLELSPGQIVFANGSGPLVKNNAPMSVADANAIIANPAGFYFNAHTALNPGGAVRGQLVRTN